MKKLLLIFILLPLTVFSQNDLSLDSAFHRIGVGGYFSDGLDYYIIGIEQISPIEFSGTISNVGTNPLTSCHLKVEVHDGTEVIYSASSDSVDLLPGESDSLFLTEAFDDYYSYGEHNIKFWVKSDAVDDNNSNDTIQRIIQVMEMTHSRSNGIIEDFYCIPDTIAISVYKIGNVYEVTSDELCLHGVRVYIPDTAANVGQPIIAEIYQYDTTLSEWNLVELLDDEIILSTNIGEYKTIYFDGNYLFENGDVFLVMIGFFSSGGSPCLALSQKSDKGTVMEINHGSAIDTLETSRVVMCRLMIDGMYSCGLNIPEHQKHNFTLNQNVPNPFNSMTTVSYSLSTATNVSIRITDINGREVYTKNYGHQSSGDHSIQLFTEDWEQGTYFYTFRAGDQQQTKRMVLIK